MEKRELENGLNIEELILQAQKGSKDAFKNIVETYKGYAYAVAFKILLNEEDAKDAVQESFVKMWKHFHEYKFQAKFSTWFYKIIINTSLDKLKSVKRKNKLIIPGFDETILFKAEESKVYSNKELVEIITALTNRLSPKQKIVFTLKDLQGLNIEDISISLNMPAGSVKTNLVYARRKIKEYLKTIYNWQNYEL